MRRQSISRNIFKWNKLFALTLFLFLCVCVIFILVPSSTLGRTSGGAEKTSYAVVMDCGSSGSRVYLYKWPQTVGEGDMLNIDEVTDDRRNPLVEKIEPGLSSCKDDPLSAFAYLKPLLEFAVKHIPEDVHQETQLFILATAGMRMVPTVAREAILQNLQTQIPLHYKFLLPQENVKVISGKEEGIFSWITLNYLLGRLQNRGIPTAGTVGSLDMGGGSMQVAFQVDSEEATFYEDRVTMVDLSCGENTYHKYELFVTTYLGFGANEARKRYLQSKVPSTISPSSGNNSRPTLPARIRDPCSPVDMHEKLTRDGYVSTIHGSGDYFACKDALLTLLRSPSNCSAKDLAEACTTDTFTRPPINTSKEFYGFSEFFYTMEDVLQMGGPYRKGEFEKSASSFCSHKWSTLDAWYKKQLYPGADENRFRTQCFKSAWMSIILHEGLGFPNNFTSLTSAVQLHSRSLQWALGALVHQTRCLPLRYVEQGKESSRSAYILWQSSGLSQGGFQLLMVGFVACILFLGFTYFRMLRTSRLRPAMIRTGSLANIVRSASFIGRI